MIISALAIISSGAVCLEDPSRFHGKPAPNFAEKMMQSFFFSKLPPSDTRTPPSFLRSAPPDFPQPPSLSQALRPHILFFCFTERLTFRSSPKAYCPIHLFSNLPPSLGHCGYCSFSHFLPSLQHFAIIPGP